MIKSEEISVVVQGNIDLKYIETCLTSIRHVLPKAELILSTWIEDKKKLNSLNLNCDKYVFSKDPGAELLNKESKSTNNINRQIISTQKGLAVATRKYILKYRSNMSLLSNNFLYFYEKHSENADFFKQKLLVVDYYTRNPRIINMPFHPSDWIIFGLSEDVKKYYNISLQSKDEVLWFKNHKNTSNLFKSVYALYSPEQYICISFLKKYIRIKCKSYYDASEKNIEITEMFLAKNMIVIDSKKNGIIFLKYSPNRYFEKSTLLTYNDWYFLNKKYNERLVFIDRIINEVRYLKCKIFYKFIRKYIVLLINKFGLKRHVKFLLNRVK